MTRVHDLRTPALLVEADALEHNLRTMAEARPGASLRPHVKAHKCTTLARRQADIGHLAFTCATIREMEGLARAGLAHDRLLANEVVDARRLGALEGRITVAVDSDATIDAATAGGTGSFDCNRAATEIQAGSYALMDTAYDRLGLPFRQALSVLSTVVSVSSRYAVADCGLKALGMDHGNPTIDGAKVWFCSDEHLTFAAERRARVGDRIRVRPAHVDPTVAYHEQLHVISGEEVLDSWEVDLRGW